MDATRTLRSSVLLLAVLYGVALHASGAAARAQQAPSSSPVVATSATVLDSADFEKGFRAASDLMARRRWKEAHEAWLVLLRRHAGLEHARPRLAEIREGLRKCSFWSVTKEPDVKSLVKGELRSYSESSGQIEIGYDYSRLGDLEPGGVLGSLFLHPLTFRGSYRIELEGTEESLMYVSLIVAFGEGRGYLVQIGGRAGTVRHHRILHLADEPEVVDERRPSAPSTEKRARKPDGPRTIRVQVKVDADTISYTYDGEKLLEARNECRTLGRWGIDVSRPFGELVVKGPIEPSWIDGRRDAFVQAARDSFDRFYHDPPELAAWSAEPPPKPGAPASVLGSFALPPVDSDEGAAIVDRVGALRRAGKPEEAAAVLHRLEPGALPANLREVLLALCTAQSDQPMRALAHLREYERFGAMPRPLRYLKASLLGEVERETEAASMLETLVAEEPGDLEPHLQLVRQLLGLGRFDDARAALERALQKCGSNEALEEMRAQLAKAQVGPEWRRKYAQSSEHFEVASDLDVASCAMAARELEDTWKRCAEWFPATLAPAARPTKVYLFSGESSYLGYIRGAVRESSENTLGVYSGLLVQIVAWNSADRDGLQYTLRHECVHHYLHRSLGDVPVWLDEGLADYVASSNVSASKWTAGAARPLFAVLLRQEQSRLADLGTFLTLDHAGFMTDGERNYPQAWAVVHFLRHGKSAEGERFLARLWDLLAEPTDAASAMSAALEGVDLAQLDAQFRAHVATLLAEPARR